MRVPLTVLYFLSVRKLQFKKEKTECVQKNQVKNF